ncbi:flagellin [Cerasibacillus terrae]|uniref:Flagellin n=1 Tax=Cerasibacillus terrae TaxID=2498845 RepID=A0A5C8NWI6_9BACI|nr:flagellin [Cerasibacillus terrae]TXL65626.1 flagellin [Cerasibacillus terrae]
MIINHNISALNTHRQLGANNNAVQGSLEKLSSGLKINRAGDDAAGLAISEKMRGQIRGLEMATKNAQDGISLIQTAEGALNETHSILQRMRELAVQSSNDTNNEVDRKELQKEFNQLIEEIDRISNNTEFNTKGLLDGSFKGKFHIGANEGQSIDLAIGNMGTSTIGEATAKGGYLEAGVISDATADFDSGDAGTAKSFAVQVGEGEAVTVTIDGDFANGDAVLAEVNSQLSGTGVKAVLNDDNSIDLVSAKEFSQGADSDNLTAVSKDEDLEVTTGAAISSLKVEVEGENAATSGGILTQSDADSTITAVNNAIEKVSAERSKLGAYQNRLEHTINNLGASAENLTAAESRIRDVDMAKEMMDFTKNNILTQAAQAMLAQANQTPQGVLQLLR